ncbi:MAG: 2TM domain-containing protein [Actinobacteria bacterium]|nr:2TM domain-containing protein [Actinomycetota bacterium]
MTDDAKRDAAIRRLKAKRGFAASLVSYVVVNLMLVGIWAVTGAGYFWPIWVMLGWGFGIVWHAWAVFGQKPITEDQIQREIDRRGDAIDE